jgi:hypothetical protein
MKVFRKEYALKKPRVYLGCAADIKRKIKDAEDKQKLPPELRFFEIHDDRLFIKRLRAEGCLEVVYPVRVSILRDDFECEDACYIAVEVQIMGLKQPMRFFRNKDDFDQYRKHWELIYAGVSAGGMRIFEQDIQCYLQDAFFFDPSAAGLKQARNDLKDFLKKHLRGIDVWDVRANGDDKSLTCIHQSQPEQSDMIYQGDYIVTRMSSRTPYGTNLKEISNGMADYVTDGVITVYKSDKFYEEFEVWEM